MGERDRQSILDQIDQQREKEKTERQSVEHAVKMLPDFKKGLGRFIATHVPSPIVDDDYYKDKNNEFNTQLTVTVTRPSGPIEINIRASAYPTNDEVAKQLDYQIDVEELNEILTIKGSEGIMQSQTRQSEPFTMDTPIGGPPRPSWPTWEHLVTVEELENYRSLIEDLKTKDVIYTGSTSPISSTLNNSRLAELLRHPHVSQISGSV